MSIETLTQQVSDLTAATTALLAKVQAQTDFINMARASAVDVVQSVIRNITLAIPTVDVGQSTDIDVTTDAYQFSGEVSVVFQYQIISATTAGYHFEVFLKDADTLTMTEVHAGQAAVGKFVSGAPFSITKNKPTDRIVVRFSNLGSVPIPDAMVSLSVLEVDTDKLGVMKSPFLTTSLSLPSISAGLTQEIPISVSGLQFSSIVTSVFSVSCKAPADSRYVIEILTKSTGGIYKQAYVTMPLIGNFADPVPFSIIKEDATDSVVLRVINLYTSALTEFKVEVRSVGVK